MDIFINRSILQICGGPVAVYEGGKSGAKTLILLHGAMYDESKLIWHNLAPRLAEEYHVVAIDFPRHGHSRPWPASTRMDREFLDAIVDGVIAQLNLSNVTLIGLSLGGGVSISYTLKHPEVVESAVLINPGGLGDKVQQQFLSWLFVATPGLLKWYTQYGGRFTHKKYRKSLSSVLTTGEKTKDFDMLVDLTEREAKAKAKYGEIALDDWQRYYLAPFKLKLNFLPELNKIDCPILLIHGEKDYLVNMHVTNEAASQIRNVKLVTINGAGHLAPLEKPAEVEDAILNWLKPTRKG